MEAEIKKLITHNGSFHTDDVFSAAALSIYLSERNEIFQIIRTRDPEAISAGDYVFDVGGENDPEKNRFDHHQPGGAGSREGDRAIEYASFGLVWKKFGAEICKSQRIAEMIDKKLAAPVDAWDNGVDLVENVNSVSPYFIQHLFFGMEPTWRETVTVDEMFQRSVRIAREILEREIIQMQDALQAEEMILDIYKSTEDKRVIVLDHKYPFQHLMITLPEPLYVVYPRGTDSNWGVKAVKEEFKSFKDRKKLPEAWAGLRDAELQDVTGVKDAVFCHRGLFLAVAKSKDGAIELARKAVDR